MSFRLFDIPEYAVPAAAESPFPLGGLGGGHFVWEDSGRFRDWRLLPGDPPVAQPVTQDTFYCWYRHAGQTHCTPLVDHTIAETRRLFPLTWRRYNLSSFDPQLSTVNLESASFSPLLPSSGYERSLPIHVVAFRAHNPTDVDTEVALLLTWACGWPELVSDAQYDMQHDNLCLTGSLGSTSSRHRQGIAVPDLHYVGIYQQGIEPWVVPDEEADVLEDFAEDGELDPRVVRAMPHGAAAWLKFTLEPGETKEAPFILTWHFPFYEDGPASGLPRYYTQFLGRVRPDNAIVWLAEQAVQHFGGETANYRYWYQAIRDWQDASRLGPTLNGISELLRCELIWTEQRGLEVHGLADAARSRLSVASTVAGWPELAELLRRT